MNNNFLDFLSVLSIVLQIQTYQQNLLQSSTDDLMKELQKQDKMYLEKILQNQELIINSVNAILNKKEE